MQNFQTSKPRPLGNHALNDPLRALLNSTNSHKTHHNKPHTVARGQKINLPSVNMIGEDGVDHINFARQARTDLGKLLSNHSMLAFNHSLAGPFKSMEGFWHYIRSIDNDDRFRVMNPQRAYLHSRNTKSHDYVRNFRLIILDAHWQRINQYSDLITALTELQIPLDYYGVKNDVRVRPVPGYWLIQGFTAIQTALKRGFEYPDFTNLLDDDSYAEVKKIPNVVARIARVREIAAEYFYERNIVKAEEPTKDADAEFIDALTQASVQIAALEKADTEAGILPVVAEEVAVEVAQDPAETQEAPAAESQAVAVEDTADAVTVDVD